MQSVLEKDGFRAGEWKWIPPAVFPIGHAGSIEQYLEDLPGEPGLQVVILLQAGAASLGFFHGGLAERTKSIKRYVVRGTGRSQSTHLKTKGKSRYGSRLRLQNAKALLEETNERLRDGWEELGDPEAVFYNAPVRLWADLCKAKPRPPFLSESHVASRPETPQIRIPLDLPVPTTDLLLRTYRALCHGRVVHERDSKE